MPLKLSNPSKLNSQAFPLPVKDTVCIGRKDQETGELLEKCSKCYADNRGFYAMPDTIRVREDNLKIIQENIEVFIFFMVGKLNRKKNKDFRWFDSGDIQSEKMGKDILDIIKKTKHITHWLPSKEYKWWKNILKTKVLPSNVALRISTPFDNIKPITKFPCTSTTYTKTSSLAYTGFKCPAHIHKETYGKYECGSCRACFNPAIKNVAYPKRYETKEI